MELAKHVSSWSKDPSTKVGAVIANGKKLLSVGFNGFPPQIEDKEEWLNDRPTKYSQTIHAEINCFLALGNVVPPNSSLYIYPLHCCAECGKHGIASGIRRIIILLGRDSTNDYWNMSGLRTQLICERAGVEYIVVNEF